METQSNHSNGTIVTTHSATDFSYNHTKKTRRARSTKEKIYETEDEIKKAGLTQEQVKREIRKLKNRIAAQKCREQKEIKITQAEDRVKGLENENLRLRNENEMQTRKIAHLEFQVKQHIIKCGEEGKADFPQIFGHGYANSFSYPYQMTNNARANTMQMNHPPNSQSFPVPVTQMGYNNVPIHTYSNNFQKQNNNFRPQKASAPQQQQQQHIQTLPPSATIKNPPSYDCRASEAGPNGPMPPQQIHQVYDTAMNDHSKSSFHTPEKENNVIPAPEIELNTEPFQSDYSIKEIPPIEAFQSVQMNQYNDMLQTEHDKFETEPPLIERRNSNTMKRKAISLNLSNISNKTFDASPNQQNPILPNLPPVRRSPRNHSMKHSKMHGLPSAFADPPKTKDVINDIICGGGSTFDFNPSNPVGMIEQSLRNTGSGFTPSSGFTPYLPIDGPVTRSAKKKRGEANSSFLF